MPASALLAATLLASLALARAESPYYHAAQCVARGDTCGDYFASRTNGACTPGSAPSDACVQAACKWCLFDAGKASNAPCTSDALRARCGPMPTATPTAAATAGNPHFFSASCIAMADACSPYAATRSTDCKPAFAPSAQSSACVASACTWCGWASKKDSSLCQTASVRAVCSGERSASDTTQAPTTGTATPASATTTPAPSADDDEEEAAVTATPSPSPAAPADAGGRGAERAPGACTWTGDDDEVVVNLGEVTPANGWERVERDGFSGLVYRPEWGAGLSPPSRGGAMCFPVRVGVSGDYFWTFVSYAPHVTEHNDAWVMSPEHSLRLWKILGNRTLETPPGDYQKAYQGNGAARGMSSEMVTVDSDGHRFTVLDVPADQTFHICLSGRSFRFSVFRLVLKKCFGKVCEGGSLWRDLVYNMPVSRCV